MTSWRDWLPVGRVPEISADQLAACLHNVQLIDVRTRREYLAGHIAGARHVPITAFNGEAIADLSLDSGRPVVTICRSAHRSIPATRQLRRLGFDARQLAGGMKVWWAKGLPMDNGKLGQ